jgi:GNAT superfamily N-acetyltransferase
MRQAMAFVVGFARRQAVRTVGFPGGFAVLDDALAFSRADNQVLVPGEVDPVALPGMVEGVLGHLPHRLVHVLDDAVGSACAGPLLEAGYTHTVFVVMRHVGPVPVGGGAEEVDAEVLRGPSERLWRGLLPGAGEEEVRQLAERRAVRRRGAGVVRFVAVRDEVGEPVAWADLYADPVAGTAQIEEVVTRADRRGRGHGDAVLAAAVRLAAAQGCGVRFLVAEAAGWPRGWYARRGFVPVGWTHCFERA